MRTILLIHGPNLNTLGRRDRCHYGRMTLAALVRNVATAARSIGLSVKAFQSNLEGELTDFIQKNSNRAVGIINAGALTHYSYAIHDALVDTGLPAIEVHLSRVQNREPWRRKSVIAPPTCRLSPARKNKDTMRPRGSEEDYMRKKRTDIPLILNAIIGNPVSHSMSPYLYTPLYRSLGIPAVLLPFGGPDVSTLVAAARVLHVHLMAVTMPFKRGVMAYLDRSVRKAAELKREFGGRLVTERELTHRSVDIIVNATLVGMRPRVAAMPVHARLIARHQCMFDLVYNPLQTALLKHAKRKGARTVSGIDMFVVQGLRQVEIWTGKKLVTSKLVERFKRALVSNRKLS